MTDIRDSYFRKAIIKRAVDGDTIDCVIDLGFRNTTTQRLRFLGVDTPEKGQPGYQEAKDFVAQFEGQEVYIQSFKTDLYDRYLALVYVNVDGAYQSLNRMLLEQGLAVPYSK